MVCEVNGTRMGPSAKNRKRAGVNTRSYRIAAVAVVGLVSGCRVARNVGARAPEADAVAQATGIGRLPTGVRLDPAGRSINVGSFPLAAVLSPDSTRLVLLLNGWREQGVQVVDRATGAVQQTLPQHAAFLGLAFSPDGSTLYALGGTETLSIATRGAATAQR